MESSKGSSLVPVQVFVDIEGFTNIKKGKGRVRKVLWLLKNLGPSLQKKGYQVTEIWVVACVNRTSEQQQDFMTRLFRDHGASLCWSDDIADEALMGEIEDRLEKGNLSKTLVLLTNDGDFAQLAEDLVNLEYHVVVTGTAMSKAFVESASEAHHLYRDLLVS